MGSGPRGEAKAQGQDARSGAEWLGLDRGSALGLGLRMVCTIIQGSRLGGGGGIPHHVPGSSCPPPRCLCSRVRTVWWERDPAASPTANAAGEGDPGGCCSQSGTRTLCLLWHGIFRDRAGLQKQLPGLCCSDKGLARFRAALVER